MEAKKCHGAGLRLKSDADQMQIRRPECIEPRDNTRQIQWQLAGSHWECMRTAESTREQTLD